LLSRSIIQKQWNSAQLYWIVANGIKLTGMPAFGPTYEKDEIAAVLALVQRLPKLSPVEYEQMAESGHHEHRHYPIDEYYYFSSLTFSITTGFAGTS
jgi:hypothetical protein